MLGPTPKELARQASRREYELRHLLGVLGRNADALSRLLPQHHSVDKLRRAIAAISDQALTTPVAGLFKTRFPDDHLR